MARFHPVVDHNRCEGKAVCAELCPQSVFDVRTLAADERGPLTPLGHVRRWLHGGRQAIVARGDDCIACQQCVKECPEGAIRLVPR